MAREVAEFEAKYPPEAFAPKPPTPKLQQSEQGEPTEQQQTDSQIEQTSAPPRTESVGSGSKEQVKSAADTVGVETNEGASEPQADQVPTNVEASDHDQNEAHNDDGGEVVEDKEDTVIY